MEDETLIADLAKGLLQAQAKISQDSQKNNTDEVMNLLSKINNQLENLQTTLNAGGQPDSQDQSSQPNKGHKARPLRQSQQQEAGSKPEAAVSQELKNLFSILLQNNSQESKGGGNGQSPGMAQHQRQQQQEQSTGQLQNQQSEQDSKGNPNSITVQTAAQVLAQAQYELSNELEASLKKLKQVISESEQIANKISNLLGEENSQK
ncbi:hypothetical protein SPTER_21040 [Sporomusa termitida]|uniref:Uncharacterized protein n=1 Tax=Sporomusa termitida TaxID=2377 RepID=A0A517DTT8_9FIRM|nr:hypothetical protein SPTER_21040 [Sporomusa termitida]